MKVLIITAYIEGDSSKVKNIAAAFSPDCTVCCDGGLNFAERFNIEPDLLIGDLDSIKQSEEEYISKHMKVLRFPVEKNESDLALALNYITEKFIAKDIELLVLGGMGGRLDHTLSNIQSLCKTAPELASCTIQDGRNQMCILKPGNLSFERQTGTSFGLIALSSHVVNLSVTGAKYSLTNGLLTNKRPFAISNEFASNKIRISFTEGQLGIIFT